MAIFNYFENNGNWVAFNEMEDEYLYLNESNLLYFTTATYSS